MRLVNIKLQHNEGYYKKSPRRSVFHREDVLREQKSPTDLKNLSGIIVFIVEQIFLCK
jgi:hypothetical protein